MPSSREAAAETYLSRELTELQELLSQQLTIAQRAVGSIDTAVEFAVQAWQEREECRVRSFELIRGILRLQDDCAELLAEEAPRRQAILQRFKSLLAEHRVHRIPVEPGDRFQGELHHCEMLQDSKVHPAGHVVEILQAGYTMQDLDGQQQLIRPAHVVVSKEKL